MPDAIHKHKKPITVSQLADALSIPNSKSHALFRLMRVLIHSNVFGEAEEGAYALTGTSRLLLRDEPLSFFPFILTTTDPVAVGTYHSMTERFWDECPTPFVTKYGRNVWEFGADEAEWNRLFNKGMTSDSELVGKILVRECKHVCEGLERVVDVAEGRGAMAKAVAAVFPGVRFVVLDLPQVVDGLEGAENVSFVSGDMFKFTVCSFC
ncbi:8-hydroxyquercetin 8-O-methyltransferase-like [Salvia splendens]|uniref:8-hydroxyquercetin 8-O-methyltransferase-like n=1 Tax=Salvia splendens TaxID=180675 RepID=UPI001C262425|nr:8-hydroxyquercetin 8-O-methyltransferase-like [Salvia splendens]